MFGVLFGKGFWVTGEGKGGMFPVHNRNPAVTQNCLHSIPFIPCPKALAVSRLERIILIM